MIFELRVKRVTDFAVTGLGDAPAWAGGEWQTLVPLGGAGDGQGTRFQCAWSALGLYFLFQCEDRKLTCTGLGDFDDLYLEDVVEVFLWPEEANEVYFEYELSPLGAELPLLVSNRAGNFMGWRPWRYEGQREMRRATSVQGGVQAPGAAVTGWTAEFFLPFALLRGLGNVPPAPGMRWRANLYRIDYDSGSPVYSAWCDRTGASFHHFREFGHLVFE